MQEYIEFLKETTLIILKTNTVIFSILFAALIIAFI